MYFAIEKHDYTILFYTLYTPRTLDSAVPPFSMIITHTNNYYYSYYYWYATKDYYQQESYF